MSLHNYHKTIRNICRGMAWAMMITAASAQAGQFTYTTPVTNSTGNNFTMLDRNGGPIGGTNDVVFDWDGTLNDAVAGAVSNASISSDEQFFNLPWVAHDVMLYGPGGPYTIDTCNDASVPADECGPMTFTVGANQIGAHMLFDWGAPLATPCGLANCDIDVAVVWNFSATWSAQNPANPFYAGADNGGTALNLVGNPCTGTGCVVDGLPNTQDTVFDLISTDVNGDGKAGTPMVDGAFSDSYANFSFNGINFPPNAFDLNASTPVDTPITIDLAANTSDPDGSVVPTSVAIVPASGPSDGALINNGDGTVTYTPNTGFESPPSDSFQYTIDDNDGATSAAATVTITVADNTAPVANDTALATDEDVALDIDVNTVATDGDSDPLTFQSFDATSAMGGTVTVDGTNTVLTYTPAINFNGDDTFVFTVTDGIDTSNTATITITVNPVNDAPVCGDVPLNTGVNTDLLIDVQDDLLSTCTDPDGDTITLDSTTQPTEPGSTLADDGAGTLTYSPATDFVGQDSFTYTATDGAAQDTRTASVAVGKIFGNFTMLNGSGTTIGGTNDIVFTWDGTCYDSVAEADAGPVNMTMGSDGPTTFFGFVWNAHDIKVYCPGGPYVFDTCNDASIPADKCGPLSMTVPNGHLGGHMLFDWNTTVDIDVAIVWNNSTGGTWQNSATGGQLYPGLNGPTPAPDEFFEWISVDADGDGIPGIQFVDGPFINFRANFNYKTTLSDGGSTVVAPRSSVSSPNVSSTGCTIGRTPVSPLDRSDWLIVAGLLAWLGFGRLQRQRTH